MFVDPKIRFWFGVVISIASGIATGTVTLTHMVPEAWVPYVVAWCAFFAIAGNLVLTTLNGLGMTSSSRIASAAADPTVQKIVTTSQPIADATGDKVVTPADIKAGK